MFLSALTIVFATQEYAWKDKSADEETRKYSDKLRDVCALAERLGCSFGQLAIAWSLKNESVQCLLLGASNIDQLYESLQSLQVMSELFVFRKRLLALHILDSSVNLTISRKINWWIKPVVFLPTPDIVTSKVVYKPLCLSIDFNWFDSCLF